MPTREFALTALLALSACAPATATNGAPARAPGTEPCEMTSLEHRQSAEREERRADVARWKTATSKQGVLERERSRRELAARPVAAAQHREAAEAASACR